MAKKKINFELIEDLESEPYKILADMRLYHEDTAGASIAMAWRKRLKMDNDGLLVLGKCIKVSDLYREFAAFDFIILLNKEVWEDPEFTEDRKRALVDHELTHCAEALDADGEPKYDERGRRVYRSRKHDLEEFREIVQRHGCYKRDLELFAEALLNKRKTPLFEAPPMETAVMAEDAPEEAAIAPAALMGGTHQRKRKATDPAVN